MHIDSVNTESSEELACRAQAGSLPCFEALVRRYQVPLLQFLKSRTGHTQEAEDLLQDTFLKAYTRIADYRREHRFRAWLFTIAYHLMISRHRANKLREKVPPALRAAPDCPTVELEAAETRQDLWSRARKVLNDELFTVLWLHYVENLTIGELSEVLSRTRVTVKVQLFRARRALATHLEYARALERQQDRHVGTPQATFVEENR